MRRLLGLTDLGALLLALGALTLTWTPLAAAEPQAITQAKTQADALRSQIEQLNAEFELAVEEYDVAKVQLERTKKEVAAADATLRATQRDLKQARTQLSTRLVAFYKQGNVGLLESLLRARSVSDVLNRVFLLKRISAEDNRLVSEVAAYELQEEDRKAELTAQAKQQTARAEQVQTAKQAVQERLAQKKEQLSGQEQQIAQMEREHAARQAALEAQARVAARAAAAQKPAAETSGEALARGAGPETGVPKPASGAGAQAVEIALKYMGVPYVWAGEDPSGFDCSGLVLYVFAQLGVELPHSSRMQYGYGTHVSRDELRPGDLVFFGDPIRHVGIYVGDGKMINAPYSGVNVRIDPVDRQDYTGATRLL